jgi:hypothetical protein
LNLEYIREYESKIEIVENSKNVYQMGWNGGKNSDQKISRYCPFKILLDCEEKYNKFFSFMECLNTLRINKRG